MTLAAHAKVNLTLRVVGRRADGLHLLESLMVPVTLADTVRMTATRLRRVSGDDPFEQPEPSTGDATAITIRGVAGDDLVARSIRAFCAAHDVSGTFDVVVEKRIPVASGMGGGSSDAGAVLRALGSWTDRPVTNEIAASVGADVPFFMQGGAAWVRGVGEVVERVSLPALSMVLANPGIPLLTRAVFEEFDKELLTLTGATAINPGSCLAKEKLFRERSAAKPVASRCERNGSPDGTAGNPTFGAARQVASLVLSVGNDLARAALQLCPEVARWTSELRGEGALAASMTGSGPTVFGLFESPVRARSAAEALRRRGCAWVVAVETRDDVEC